MNVPYKLIMVFALGFIGAALWFDNDSGSSTEQAAHQTAHQTAGLQAGKNSRPNPAKHDRATIDTGLEVPQFPITNNRATKAAINNPFKTTTADALLELMQKEQWQQAISFYQNQCLDTQEEARCRNNIYNIFKTLWLQRQQLSYQNLETITELYLDVDPDDAVARYYQSLVWAKQGQNKIALEQLQDLRFQNSDLFADGLIEKSINAIFEQHYKQLIKNNQSKSLLEFMKFMMQLDNSNQEYQFLLGQIQYQLNQDTDALKNLSALIYHHQWGEKAQAIIDLIKQKYQKSKDQISANQSKRYQIPLERHGQHFYVSAVVDQQYPLKLLIDTGASITAIKDGVVHFQEEAEVKNATFNTAGGIVTQDIYRVTSFAIGKSLVEDMRITVLNQGHSDSNSDGLLGMNYLGQFNFYIDQTEAILYLHRRP